MLSGGLFAFRYGDNVIEVVALLVGIDKIIIFFAILNISCLSVSFLWKVLENLFNTLQK